MASGAFPPEAGRPVAAENLHLTLAFLGDVSADKQQALIALAGRIRQPGFTLNLDDAGQWLRSRVVWLGTRQSPRGLLQLANILRAQAARSGCYQSPQPFHPHVTLLRDASHAVAIPPPGFGWSFPVTEFALYASSFFPGTHALRQTSALDAHRLIKEMRDAIYSSSPARDAGSAV